MPIYTDNRTGNLFIKFSYKGEVTKKHLPPGTTRTEAKQYETKLRGQAFALANGMAPRDEVLFDDAVQEYLGTILSNPAKFQRAEHVLIAAKPFLKGKPLRHIKPMDVEKFMRHRMATPTMHGTPRKPATVWREMSVISRLFSFAVKNDLCEVNPCGKVDKPVFDNQQDTVLSREDEPKFLAAFDAWQGEMARDICILALHTGLRQNDLLRLSDFQISGDTIRLTQGKTSRIIEVPLNDVALAVVKKYSGKGLLFPSPKTGKPMHYIRKAIAGACRRAEIAPITIRDLRRTFATRLTEAGVDALTISKCLGHRDMRMVPRYARSNETMRKAVEKLSQSCPAVIIEISKAG